MDYSLEIPWRERVDHDQRYQQDCVFRMGPSAFIIAISSWQWKFIFIVPEYCLRGGLEVVHDATVGFCNVIVPGTIRGVLELTSDISAMLLYIKDQRLPFVSNSVKLVGDRNRQRADL
jgi:hypothetical protein